MASILKELGRQLFHDEDDEDYSWGSDSSCTTDEESVYSVTDKYRKKKTKKKRPLLSKNSNHSDALSFEKSSKKQVKVKKNVKQENFASSDVLSVHTVESGNTEVYRTHSLQQTRLHSTRKRTFENKLGFVPDTKAERKKTSFIPQSKEEKELSQTLKDFWDEVDTNVASINTSDLLEGPNRSTDLNSFSGSLSSLQNFEKEEGDQAKIKSYLKNKIDPPFTLSGDVDADDADSLVYSINTSNSSVSELKTEQMAQLIESVNLPPLLKVACDDDDDDDDDTLYHYLEKQDNDNDNIEGRKKGEGEIKEDEEKNEVNAGNKENIECQSQFQTTVEIEDKENRENLDLIWAHPHDGSSADVTLQDLVWIHPHDGSFEDVELPKPKSDANDNIAPLETISESGKPVYEAKEIKKNEYVTVKKEKTDILKGQKSSSPPHAEKRLQASNSLVILHPVIHSNHSRTNKPIKTLDENPQSHDENTKKSRIDIVSTKKNKILDLKLKYKSENNQAAVVIQTWFRSLNRKSPFLDYEEKLQEDSAIRIQCIVRGRSLRHVTLSKMGIAKRQKWEPRTKSPEITLLHSKIRREARAFLRSKPNLRTSLIFAIRRVCAIKIQSGIRLHLFRSRLNDHLDLHNGAATIIQKILRGYYSRKCTAEKFNSLHKSNKEIKAATCIQSFWRSHIQRILYLKYLEQDNLTILSNIGEEYKEQECMDKPIGEPKTNIIVQEQVFPIPDIQTQLFQDEIKISSTHKNPRGSNHKGKKSQKLKEVKSPCKSTAHLLDSSWDKFQDSLEEKSDSEYVSTSLLSAFRRQRRKLASMLGFRRRNKTKATDSQQKLKSFEQSKISNLHHQSRKQKVRSILRRRFKSRKKSKNKEIDNSSNETSLNLADGEEMDKRLSSSLRRISKYDNYNDNRSLSSESNSEASDESKHENNNPAYVELDDGDFEIEENLSKENEEKEIFFPWVENTKNENLATSDTSEFDFDPFKIGSGSEIEFANKEVTLPPPCATNFDSPPKTSTHGYQTFLPEYPNFSSPFSEPKNQSYEIQRDVSPLLRKDLKFLSNALNVSDNQSNTVSSLKHHEGETIHELQPNNLNTSPIKEEIDTIKNDGSFTPTKIHNTWKKRNDAQLEGNYNRQPFATSSTGNTKNYATNQNTRISHLDVNTHEEEAHEFFSSGQSPNKIGLEDKDTLTKFSISLQLQENDDHMKEECF